MQRVGVAALRRAAAGTLMTAPCARESYVLHATNKHLAANPGPRPPIYTFHGNEDDMVDGLALPSAPAHRRALAQVPLKWSSASFAELKGLGGANPSAASSR
jgi:hypothetical protein